MRIEDDLEIRRAGRRLLDDRLLGIGFRAGYRHADHCLIGRYREAPCTCRQAVTAPTTQARRSSERGGRFLTR
jgi:hypothetical protein